MEGNSISERVEDVRVAQEGAYAAKPFEDSLREYREVLSQEARDALKLIADREGEKAMAAFKETRSLEDPRVDALRALASETVILGSNKSAFKNDVTANVAEGMLKQLGEGVVDRLIADETTDFPTKAERIKGLGVSMNEGVHLALKSSAWPVNITEGYSQEFGHGQWTTDSTTDILRGYFAAAIITGGGPRSVAALAEIGRLESRDPTEVISEHMPLILEMKQRYPDEVNRPFAVGTRIVRALDRGLETQGFLWSPGAGTYVHMGSTQTPMSVPK